MQVFLHLFIDSFLFHSFLLHKQLKLETEGILHLISHIQIVHIGILKYILENKKLQEKIEKKTVKPFA